MGKHTGDLVEIAIAKESSRGTAVAPTYGLKWADCSLDDKAIISVDKSRSGIIEDARDSKVVGTFAEGEISGPIRDRSFGLLLLSLLGTDTPTLVSGETIVYDHTMTVAQNNQHPSLTIHRKDPNGGRDYALGMVDSVEISVETDKHAAFSAGVRAKAGAAQARTVTYASENIFLPQHASLKLAATQAGLDAASAINVRSAKIKINGNVDDDRSLGSTVPSDIINGNFAIDAEFEIVRDADTYITALLAGTAYALRLDITNTDVTLGVSSSPRVRIDLHSVVLKEADTDVGPGDLAIQTISFKAHYKETDSKMISAIVRNLVASY